MERHQEFTTAVAGFLTRAAAEERRDGVAGEVSGRR
jgi:hypothetical protein